MARWYGTTSQRGLGSPHVADKKRLKALLKDGEPCWRCGQPMYKWQELDRDHLVDRALGGAQGPAVLAHASCNRAAGSRLGNQLQPRNIAAAGRDTICATCGKPYHYAARACEICGAHYHPNHTAQRSCGRACGLEVKRRNGNLGGRRGKSRMPPPDIPAMISAQARRVREAPLRTSRQWWPPAQHDPTAEGRRRPWQRQGESSPLPSPPPLHTSRNW